MEFVWLIFNAPHRSRRVRVPSLLQWGEGAGSNERERRRMRLSRRRYVFAPHLQKQRQFERPVFYVYRVVIFCFLILQNTQNNVGQPHPSALDALTPSPHWRRLETHAHCVAARCVRLQIQFFEIVFLQLFLLTKYIYRWYNIVDSNQDKERRAKR